MNYQRNNYHDRDTTDYRADLTERNISLFSGLQTKLGSYPAAIQGLYQYSRLNSENEGIVSQKFLQLKSSLSFSIKHYVTFKPALIFENLALNPSFTGNHFSPELEIVATPNDKLGVILKFSSGYSSLNYSNLWEVNQFVSQRLQFIPSKKELDAKLGIEVNPLSKVTVSGIVTYQKWDKYSYWVREAKSGLFTLDALKNLTFTTVALQSTINLLPNLKLDAGIHFVWDDVQADSATGNDPHTPYLEKFRMPVSLGYRFDRTTEASLSFHWIGPRFISLHDDTKLAAFGLLQMNIEKRVQKHISAYLKGDNLLNQNYQLWQNFPGMKLYFEIGLKGNW
jgi:outer membrane receptor protein involved in Fe transport